MKPLTFISMVTALQFVRFSSLSKFYINPNRLIFKIFVSRFWIICHPMIVFTSPRFFAFYLILRFSLNWSNKAWYFEASKKSSKYTLIIIMSSFWCPCYIKILAFVLKTLKPKLFKKNMTFWFYDQSDYYNLYILCNNWYT